MATVPSSSVPMPPPLLTKYDNSGKVGFARKLKAAFRMIGKHIERMWVLLWVLPRSYPALGREVYGTDDCKTEFPDNDRQIKGLVQKIAMLEYPTNADAEAVGVTNTIERKLLHLWWQIQAKAWRYRLEGLFRNLGRVAYAKSGENAGTSDVVLPIKAIERRMESIKAEIARLSKLLSTPSTKSDTEGNRYDQGQAKARRIGGESMPRSSPERNASMNARLEPCDLVGKEGMPQWTQASTIRQFFPGGPPPLPVVAVTVPQASQPSPIKSSSNENIVGFFLPTILLVLAFILIVVVPYSFLDSNPTGISSGKTYGSPPRQAAATANDAGNSKTATDSTDNSNPIAALPEYREGLSLGLDLGSQFAHMMKLGDPSARSAAEDMYRSRVEAMRVLIRSNNHSEVNRQIGIAEGLQRSMAKVGVILRPEDVP